MIVDDLGQRGRLVADGEITHRYPVCWRCGTELIYRLVDEWFIRCDEIRQPMIEAARGVEWTPRAVRQAHGGLAASTWATGASAASATGACRCRSTSATTAT